MMKKRFRKSKLRHVALLYPVAVPWMAQFTRGVADYAERHGGWTLLTSPPTLSGADELALNVFSLRDWQGDGAIAALGSRAEARAAAELAIPVVNFGGALPSSTVPRVMSDHYAVGRLAAEHLLERGFPRLAYYGIQGVAYSALRANGFQYVADKAGVPCDVLQAARVRNPRASWRQRVQPLELWLRRLKPPVGLMAVHDYRARVVIDECRLLGLRVPEDVAVVGVDNDPSVCDFAQPTLTSIARHAWRNGYEAAAMLDTLMAGGTPVRDEVLIVPEGVVRRQSTDTIVIEQPDVAAAVHYMRDHLDEPLGIAQVVAQLAISRRRLEQRFRRTLHCTPHEYLCRLRIERAKEWLSRPERVKLHHVASECGFASAARLRLVFQRFTGQTPMAFRRAHRRSAPK